MSKFDSPLAEAAYAIANHGFSVDDFGTVQDIGWNAIVTVSSTVLMNLGENEIREKFDAHYGDETFLVWVREGVAGSVTVVESGTDSGLRSGSDLVNEAFDRARDEYVAFDSERNEYES